MLLESERAQVAVEAARNVLVRDDTGSSLFEPRGETHAVVDMAVRVDDGVQRSIRVLADVLVDVRTDLDDAAVDHHDPLVGDEGGRVRHRRHMERTRRHLLGLPAPEESTLGDGVDDAWLVAHGGS